MNIPPHFYSFIMLLEEESEAQNTTKIMEKGSPKTTNQQRDETKSIPTQLMKEEADESTTKRHQLGHEINNDDDTDHFLMKIVRERCQQTHAIDGGSQVASSPDELSIDEIFRFAAIQDKRDSQESIQPPGEAETAHDHLHGPNESPRAGASAEESGIPGAYAVAFVPCQGSSRTMRVVRRRDETSTDLDLEEGVANIEQESDIDSCSNADDNDASATATTSIEDAVLVEDVVIPAPKSKKASEEVIEGEPWRKRRERPWWTGWLRLFGFFIVGAMVLVLSLTLTNHDIRRDTPHSSDDPLVYPPYSDKLSLEIIRGIGEVGSSYYRANAWILNDPYFENYSSARKRQRFQMAYFYFQSNGQNWINNEHWLSYDVSECEWFMYNSSLSIGGWQDGMEAEPICDQDGNLRVFNLTSNNLNGTSPVQSSGISPRILIFDVSNNFISGPMPPVGGFAADMEVFIMSNNQVEGQILGQHGMKAFKQRIVKLDGNQLLGHFPGLCTILPNLEVLDVSGNLFDQDLRHIYLCKNITYLHLANNYYSGSIPSELGLLTSLKEVDVSGNAMMSGVIPSELGLVRSLQYLNTTNTNITGPIPEDLCRKQKEHSLNVAADCDLVQCCD